MGWRKWVVRGLVFFALGGLTLVGALYQYLTNPEAIRRQILARLQSDLVGVHVSLDSARLRLFGGIAVQELRLSRRDDLDKSDFLYIPSAILYHDKEHLLQGKLSIRKVELYRLRLRAVRSRDGRWNLAGLLKEGDTGAQMPTLVIKQGTLVIEDRQAAPGTSPIEIKNLHLAMVNDPLSVVTFEGSGSCDVAGPVRLHGRWQRGGAATLNIDLPAIDVGPDLVQRLAGYCPDAAVHARQLAGKGSLQATLTWDSRLSPSFRYTVDGKLEEGSFNHGQLPWPLERLHGSFRCINGNIPHAELHAHAGPVRLDLTARDLAPPPAGTPWTEAARTLDLIARHVPVTPELFERLPPELQTYQKDYRPSGPMTVRLIFNRLGSGEKQTAWALEAEDMKALYAPFPYPVQKVRGSLTVTTTTRPPTSSAESPPESRIKVDLSGEAGGKPVFLKGELGAEQGPQDVKLDLWGNDLPLDETLLTALPEAPRHAAGNFRPTGRVDFRVFIRRPRGKDDFDTRFLIHLHDGTVCYRVFPLPLRDVKVTLDIRPDRWKFLDFVGHHGDGVIRASGQSEPLAPPAAQSPRDRVSLTIEGQDVPLDEQFRAALGPGRPGLAAVWDILRLDGRMSFAAHIDNLPDHPQDIDVTVQVRGCRMNPKFFPYPLDDVTATVRYARSGAWLTDFHAHHGSTVLRIGKGTILFPREGGFWARLEPVQASALAPDASLRRALPTGMGRVLETLQLRQPLDIDVQQLVIKQTPDSMRPTLYWRGMLKLHDASFQTGIDWTGVTGEVSLEGLYNGEQLEDVIGNAFLDRATVLNQPLRRVRVPLVVWKNSPDILRLPGVSAELYGGTLGGEARIEFGSIFRYELLVRASQVHLEQFGQRNLGSKAELSGLATAGLHLTGEGDLSGLKGSGVVDVPNGKMYRLPLLLDLLKWLGLRLPDRTAFEQARATFTIDGDRVQINQLDLFGNAVSVRGQGTVKLDGSDLNLDLNADWGRIAQLLPPGINDLSREISNQLLRIKVRGKIGAVRFEKELVPIVTDPLKRVWTGAWPGAQKKQ